MQSRGGNLSFNIYGNVTSKQCHDITYGPSDRKRESEIEICTIPKTAANTVTKNTVSVVLFMSTVALDLNRSS